YSKLAYRHTFAGDFNGTNSYFFRQANSDFDFSKGDWHFSARVNPRLSADTGTLFCITNQSGCEARIFIDAQMALGVSACSNGIETLSLTAPAGVIASNQYQKVSVQQLFDRWFIRVNDVLVASATNTTRLAPAVGQVFIGC